MYESILKISVNKTQNAGGPNCIQRTLADEQDNALQRNYVGIGTNFAERVCSSNYL